MKNLNLSLLISIILLISSCSSQNKNAYRLTGTAKDIPNDSWIYLILENENIDSTQIINEKFQFTGAIDHPMQFNLLIKETHDYTHIWLEKGEIIFEAEKGKFRDAKIIGSQSQIEDEKFWGPIHEYRAKRDSLSRIVYNKEINDGAKKSAKIEFQKVWKNRFKAETEFIKDYPNSYVSATTLDFYATTFGKSKTQKLFDAFGEELKTSSYGKSIQRYLELNNEPKIGDNFVDFEMEDQEGKMRKISDIKDKFILLEFWASNCGACLQENPQLVKTYEKYKPYGFEIFAVSNDSKKSHWLDAIKKDQIPWINVCDLKGRDNTAFLIYGINGTPDSFLIDKNGKVIARDLRGEKLNEKLAELMPEPSNVHD